LLRSTNFRPRSKNLIEFVETLKVARLGMPINLMLKIFVVSFCQ